MITRASKSYHKIVSILMLTAVMLSAVSTFNTWVLGSVNTVYAQSFGGNQSIAVDGLTSNLTQASSAGWEF
jgi:hypothetical protein